MHKRGQNQTCPDHMPHTILSTRFSPARHSHELFALSQELPKYLALMAPPLEDVVLHPKQDQPVKASDADLNSSTKHRMNIEKGKRVQKEVNQFGGNVWIT